MGMITPIREGAEFDGKGRNVSPRTVAMRNALDRAGDGVEVVLSLEGDEREDFGLFSSRVRRVAKMVGRKALVSRGPVPGTGAVRLVDPAGDRDDGVRT